MTLSDPIKERKNLASKPEREFFWVIKISLDILWVALAKIKDSQIEVVETKKRKLSGQEGLEGLTEKVKQACDAISSDREVLPKEVFLGLPQSWLENGELKKLHLSALKQLVSKLGFTLVGFVGTHQAVLDYLARKESTPPNVILLELAKDRLGLSVSKVGQVKAGREEEIKDSPAQSLEKALKEVFTGESLPPRIILFGEEVGEEGKREILAYSWGETGLFLHLPKVEILPYDSTLLAVADAFRQNLVPIKAYQREAEVELTREELGFVLEKDIAKEAEEILKGEATSFPEKKLASPLPSFRLPRLSPIFQLRRLKELVKGYSFPALKFKTPVFPSLARPALLGGLVFLVLLATFGLYWYLPKADVVIFVEPKILEETLPISVAPRLLEASESARVVVGVAVEAEVSSTQSLAASGKKSVGETAKGKVTIFNKTLAEKTFLGGMELVGLNNLRFDLAGPVTVDAATISTVSGSETKTYGRTVCEVTAKDIGSEYNLPAGIEFSFAEYAPSFYSARSDESFSGGSSREITVVSGKDLERLEASLSAQLKEKAREELIKTLVAEDKTFLPEAIELKVKRKEFSQKVGEEADQITLTMDTKAWTLVYSKADLEKILAEYIAQAIPDGFELVAGEMETKEKFIEKKEEELILEVHFKVNLLPKLAREKIRTDLVGRSPSVAKVYLDKLPNVVGSQVYIWPPLPSRFLTLPHRAGRIKVRVEKR